MGYSASSPLNLDVCVDDTWQSNCGCEKNAAAITIPEGLKTPMCPLSLWMEVVNLLSFHLAKQLGAAEHLWPLDGHSQRLLVFI